MVSLTVGLTLAVLVAVLAIILALRIPCSATSRRRQKELSNENISRDDSPGPSDKSSGSKEVDDCDEKNPDVVPETIEPDDQVRICSLHVILEVVILNQILHILGREYQETSANINYRYKS